MSLIADHLDLLMVAGVLVLLLSGYPVAFALGGGAVLFALLGAAFGVGLFAGGDLAIMQALFLRVFGIMDSTSEVLLAVPLFIVMGVTLERSKVAAELLETMGRLFGGLPGGLGVSVILVGALLAASTGIVGATVVAMGLISLPTMLRNGYSAPLACGAVAASGTLGQIIPPSIVLVILGDTISNAWLEARRAAGDWSPDPVTVGDLFAGAMIPGLLLVGLYLVYLLAVAFLRPTLAPAMTAPGSASALRRGAIAWLPATSLVIGVLAAVRAGPVAPFEAAIISAIGAAAVLATGLIRGRAVSRPATFGLLATLLVAVGLFSGLVGAAFFSWGCIVALLAEAALAIGARTSKTEDSVSETEQALNAVAAPITGTVLSFAVILVGLMTVTEAAVAGSGLTALVTVARSGSRKSRTAVVLAALTVFVWILCALTGLPLLIPMLALWIACVAVLTHAVLDSKSAPETRLSRTDGAHGFSALLAVLPTLALSIGVLGSILAGAATPTEAAAVGAVGAMLIAGARLRGSGRKAGPEAMAAAALVAALLLAMGFDLRLSRPDPSLGDRVAIAAAAIACAAFAVGLIGSLLSLHRTRAEAGLRTLADIGRQSLSMTAMVFAIFIGAQAFVLVFRALGGDHTVEQLLTDIPGGPWAVFWTVMAVMFVLGFFLDFLEITFVVVPLVAPVLFGFTDASGAPVFHPVWLAVMIAVNLQTSFLTPPFGFALFYLRGAAPAEVTTLDIWKGALPFVLLQLAALGLVAAWPQLATWLPGVVG